jgi:creatinine amidohydrolase/Fe(II)-dependent formamide hydrolase-like protein
MKSAKKMLILAVALSTMPAAPFAQEGEPIWDIAVGGVDTVFMEEMTAGEVAAAIRNGKTSVIVATGGLEQNGPNVATGKHNYVLRVMTDSIARAYGNTLVSSIVQFVPEGDINPPTGHMRMAGTISLRQSTFDALLTDICQSLKQHGFENIFLLGDSGGNRGGMQRIADNLNAAWNDARVHHIREYYEEDLWSYDYLKEIGIVQLPDEKTASRGNIHTDIVYESVMALVDPELVRASTRLANGDFSVHSIEFESAEAMQEMGRKIVAYRTDITVQAMQEAVKD